MEILHEIALLLEKLLLVLTLAFYSADSLWVLEIISCNFLGSSCDNTFQLFQRMFPDSGIVKSSSIQRTKFT